MLQRKWSPEPWLCTWQLIMLVESNSYLEGRWECWHRPIRWTLAMLDYRLEHSLHCLENQTVPNHELVSVVTDWLLVRRDRWIKYWTNCALAIPALAAMSDVVYSGSTYNFLCAVVNSMPPRFDWSGLICLHDYKNPNSIWTCYNNIFSIRLSVVSCPPKQ